MILTIYKTFATFTYQSVTINKKIPKTEALGIPYFDIIQYRF